MGKILKRFIYGYIVLVVVMLIGLVVMTIHHVVSTEINEKATKEFVYDFILELQEKDYETMATMMVLEDATEVTIEHVEKYIGNYDLKVLAQMSAADYWRTPTSNKVHKGYNVRFNYNDEGYKFVCVEMENSWKILYTEP